MSSKKSRRKPHPRRGSMSPIKTGKRKSIGKKTAAVIKNMRASGVSLTRAAKDQKVSRRTVLKRAGSALRKKKTGRYAAKTSDRLVRVLRVPTSDGTRDISVRNSLDASRLGRYWAAVHKYLATGSFQDLEEFRDQFVVDTSGEKFPLITDSDVLDELGFAGVVSFESLYAGGGE